MSTKALLHSEHRKYISLFYVDLIILPYLNPDASLVNVCE